MAEHEKLVEKMARAFFEKMFERTPPPATFDAIMAADRLIGSENEFMAGMRAAISVLREALSEPSEAQWSGLARDLIMWHDMGDKTPRALFDHLTMLRREIPDWLRNEPEMQALDHVPSKGTRAALIYRAMIAASPIGEK